MTDQIGPALIANKSLFDVLRDLDVAGDVEAVAIIEKAIIDMNAMMIRRAEALSATCGNAEASIILNEMADKFRQSNRIMTRNRPVN